MKRIMLIGFMALILFACGGGGGGGTPASAPATSDQPTITNPDTTTQTFTWDQSRWE